MPVIKVGGREIEFDIEKLSVRPGDVLFVWHSPGDSLAAYDFISALPKYIPDLRAAISIPTSWKTGFIRKYLDSLSDDDGEEIYASYRSLAEEQLEKFLRWIEEEVHG